MCIKNQRLTVFQIPYKCNYKDPKKLKIMTVSVPLKHRWNSKLLGVVTTKYNSFIDVQTIFEISRTSILMMTEFNFVKLKCNSKFSLFNFIVTRI